MKTPYLFASKFKTIGLWVLIPSALIGLVTLITEYQPDALNVRVPAIFIDRIFESPEFFGMTKNNILDEILGVLIIISALMVAFSKEKSEDEYISKVRLESLVWAVYFNYGILLITFLFIYDFSFLWIMIFNMFTILLFFIIRFNWQITKLKKSVGYDEYY